MAFAIAIAIAIGLTCIGWPSVVALTRLASEPLLTDDGAPQGIARGGGMEGYWAIVVLVGLLIASLAQLIAAGLCFSLHPGRGLAALVVPGYLFVGIKGHRFYRKVIGLWIAGLLAILVGTIALN